MISKYHKTFVWDKLKIVRKFKCVQLVLVLVNVSDEKNYDSWKYTSSKERSRCQRKWRLFLSSSCSLEGETSDEKHKEISKSSPSLFQKNPKDFELLLFAIFNFFNANFSRVIFLDWSNWLIMVVYCYCQIPSMLRSIANTSDGNALWRLVLWEVFFPRSCIIWIFQTKRDAYYLTDYLKKQAVPRLQTRC